MVDQSVLSNIVTTFGPLFAIANPFGAVPIFLGLVPPPSQEEFPEVEEYRRERREYKKESREQAKITAATVFLVLIISLIVGQWLFKVFGINLDVLRIAGGLIVFVIGWKMISVEDSLADSERKWTNRSLGNIAIVPLAIPLISGPGAISVVISQTQNFTQFTAYLGSFIAIGLLSLIILLLLSASEWISGHIGKDGISALERIFGFIVLSIAIAMLSDGIFGVLRNYGPLVIQSLKLG
ncbi:MAG: MarC family protein [Cyanobacteriota bacterium]|nr:MarC family protein [Cyanobacteriota bacterium]